MSTHNICFRQEIRKILCGYPLLSVAMHIGNISLKTCKSYKQTHAIHMGPVVQSIVSLTSSLRVISLTVLADSIYNILIFIAEKM